LHPPIESRKLVHLSVSVLSSNPKDVLVHELDVGVLVGDEYTWRVI
jgi:hypothetical protein